MPELPEVEVVRAGLAPAVTGARVVAAQVLDARALKRHVPLAGDDGLGGHGVTLSADAASLRVADFERRVTGLTLQAPLRRGKFMWIPVLGGSGEGEQALLAHLGMSGQMLLRSNDAADDRHVRIRLWIEHPEHGELRLDFADQRLFGSLALEGLVVDGAGSVPAQAAHIARDPLDPFFDDAAFVAALRSRSRAVKQLILDQSLVSGVGNIYADEALWRARLHPESAGSSLSERKAVELLSHLREVFSKALAEGGTSFDEQYVNVNGQAGYFSHSLNSYGRTGEPCNRCGTAIKRIPFAGRSSHFCPRCQRLAR
ncbi:MULTISPECIES: bifunctional DNA-formamidopyrimidine glycosylase/DNA-(apurinic or apyrimidinic site) lyase [unclassified Leucobacter]|uniref:bifunctional DNA-formamidopyrimidine glycosylase/DNA-(apurinic or apyrimidinic site) lyase n=1 Tax=unclassified Leucobacter TaxID=2621730 RepID=UPI00165DB1B2|nr:MULTISPECIES: bifunctional DNA-formamidopyrimidine glycosylase/DNA-(apurinic or apyrimidinic site) lyase [unclassified Leucobacter]MBC9936946.1 bifunctional DNA-formamidopyrimidine glycosylase/DNA-(apurinic or apyrimidinic site) lyase [Leucobacter sp. cx-87]